MWNWFRKKNYLTASVDELRSALNAQSPETLFVDVRTETEWRSGHIGPFRHIPMNELPEHLKELGNYAKVYFLCYSGGRSWRAAKLLADTAHIRAVNLLGGISEWIARGYAI